MGQIASRHRPLSHNPTLSSTTHSSSSSTRVADQSSTHSSHHNSDLSNQAPLPSKRSNRRSFLGTLRSPLRHSSNHQRTSTPQADAHRPNAHKRWTLYGRRKPSEPARAPPDQLPGYDEAQQPATAPTTTTADLKGKAKEDNPAASAAELVNATMSGPSSSSSSATDASQPNSMPFLGTATDVSSPSTSSPPTSRDPVAALNHDPRPLPTISIEPDNSTPNWPRDNPEPFDVMERPATPPDPAQAPPPETRRNFPAAGTLVVVQGVVHTSDVSQSNSAEPSDAASHPASSAPPSGERPSRRRFSDLLSRPIRSRRSSYAAPESQSSETTASTESENQEESSATSEASQEQPVQDDPPVPASRPLSLSPTSIDVLGTLLSVATAATAASLVSGSSDPLLTSGLALPGMQGMQPTPSPMSEQGHGLGHSHSLSQSSSQGQSRPLSPTPTAGLASRDRVRNAWAGLRDRLGLRPSSPTSAPVLPPAMSPSPEPEPPLSPNSPTTPVDPRTQLLADMARAFQMGMGLDDTPGSGSRSGDATQASPAVEVSLGDEQQRQQQQQQAQQQERPPPAEDSFERFLMDLQVDLRRTLEDGQPEAEPEAERTPDRGQDAEPSRVDVPPLVYPQESPLSVADLASVNADIDGLPALPPDNDDLLSDDGLDADDEDDREPEAETAAPSSSQPTPQGSQTPRRTVAGSERRPGGGINWWRMYRFPPMVVPQGSGAPGSVPSPTSPSSPPPPTFPSTEATATATGDASAAEGQQRNEALPTSPDLQGAQTQEGNTVVPVIVVGLQSVHGHGHRHAEGRDEHPPLPPPLLPQDQTHDNEHALQDELAGEVAAESPRDRERERRWSTRAADALRGFRPPPGAGTARHESSAPGSGAGEGGARTGDDGHGSTTFFIYVIGGYYPPNHQLVVGTDPLDSFEELAELLGQVKPPTATKEDIDNSGLEVIRSGVLVEYEKVGRIAPMCVDRCLICLEDYDPEEDLRLLSCRHVFHRDCVDRWLETGRNNCPACRSQGVTTNPGSIPIPSSA